MKDGFLNRVADEIRYWTQPDWSLADVEEHYDAIAEHYDEINEKAHSHFRRFTDAMRLASLPEQAHVLEIFSRTGEGTAYFYQQGKVKSAVCVDVSSQMGKICRRRLQNVGLKDFKWLKMSDYSLSLPNEAFDVVFFLESAEHVSEPERLIAELARVTKPEGIMILSTPNVLWEPMHALAAITKLHHSEGPHRFIRYKRLLAMVEKAGFTVEESETNVLIPAGPQWLIDIGKRLEKGAMRFLMPWVGLRRFLVCRKRRQPSAQVISSSLQGSIAVGSSSRPPTGVLGLDYFVGRKRKRPLAYRLRRRTDEVEAALQRYGDGQLQTIVDIGTADGLMLNDLQQRMGPLTFLGVDLSFALLRANPADDVFKVQGRALRVPARSGIADAIIATAVIEHVPDALMMLRECARVLHPGGLLVLTPPDPFMERLASSIGLLEEVGHQETFNLAQLRDLVQANGFKVLEARKFMFSPIGFPAEKTIERIFGPLGLSLLMANQLLVGRRKVIP